MCHQKKGAQWTDTSIYQLMNRWIDEWVNCFVNAISIQHRTPWRGPINRSHVKQTHIIGLILKWKDSHTNSFDQSEIKNEKYGEFYFVLVSLEYDVNAHRFFYSFCKELYSVERADVIINIIQPLFTDLHLACVRFQILFSWCHILVFPDRSKCIYSILKSIITFIKCAARKKCKTK